jgi:hypothetical protein
MRERTTRRALERIEAKREKKAANAQARERTELDDPAYRAELGLPDEMPDDALDVMAQAAAQMRTWYRPNPATCRRYGLPDTPAAASLE